MHNKVKKLYFLNIILPKIIFVKNQNINTIFYIKKHININLCTLIFLYDNDYSHSIVEGGLEVIS